MKDGVLYTADAGILVGVTRNIILQLARQLDIDVSLHSIHVDIIDTLDEACMSSSSRGLVPIVKIDDTVIGAGKVGEITQLFWQQYQTFVTEHIQLAVEEIK